MEQHKAKQQTSHGQSLLRGLVAFNHLVELETINKPIAVSALGFLYSIEVSGISFNLSTFFWGLLSIALILFYVMIVNDCFDVEDDRLKGKYSDKKIVISEEISIRGALLISTIMLLIGLAVAWFVSELSFFTALLIVVISTLYSVPPIRYKQKFPFSTLGEIAGSFLPFIFGYAILGSIDYRAVVVTTFFALTQIFWRLVHERRFRDIDLKTGKKTVAVVYGLKVAKAISRICVVLAVSEILVLFFLGWFSLDFLFFLGLFYLFGFGFWYYLRKYIPKIVYRAIGPTWGVFYVILVALFLTFAPQALT